MRYPQLSGTLLTQSLNALNTSCVGQLPLIFWGKLIRVGGSHYLLKKELFTFQDCSSPTTAGAGSGKSSLSWSHTAINGEIMHSAKPDSAALPSLLHLLRNQASRLNWGFITGESPNVLLITDSYQPDGELGIPSSWLSLLGKCCSCSSQPGVCFAAISCTLSGFLLFNAFYNSGSSYFAPS